MENPCKELIEKYPELHGTESLLRRADWRISNAPLDNWTDDIALIGSLVDRLRKVIAERDAARYALGCAKVGYDGLFDAHDANIKLLTQCREKIIPQLKDKNDALRAVLIQIRDSTYRSSVTLRGMADAALAGENHE